MPWYLFGGDANSKIMYSSPFILIAFNLDQRTLILHKGFTRPNPTLFIGDRLEMPLGKVVKTVVTSHLYS